MTQTDFTLIDPQTRNLAFRLYEFEDDNFFTKQKVYNYYSIILVVKGSGKLKSDFSEYQFEAHTLMCFSVYQPFVITAENDFEGVLINFHPDFFCIHKHQEEVACNGILFNNIYTPPLVPLTADNMEDLLSIAKKIKLEIQHQALAQFELLVSWLKVFLITASRIKINQQPDIELQKEKQPFILKNLKDTIEEHFRTKHSPSDYAGLLNISAKALNRISKTHLNRTLRDLISERLIIEAKRELYLTSKPVKSIAYELGFQDEFYFSRFFKNNTEVSPITYRTTVGSAKGELT